MNDINYEQLFNQTRMAMVVSDQEGVVVAANPAAAHLLGHETVDELVGQWAADYYVDPDERDWLIEQLTAHGTVGYFEARLRRANSDDTYIDVVGCSTVHYDEAGSPVRFEALFLDVTSYREAQRALERSRRDLMERDHLLQAVIDTPDFLFVKDVQGRYRLLNQAGAEFMGLASPLQAIDKVAADLFEPELAAQIEREDGEVLSKQKTVTFERNTPSNGKMYHLSVIKYPYWNIDGELSGVIGVARDITSLKEQAQALRHSVKIIESAKQEWEATVDSLSQLVVLLDGRGQVLRSNLTLEMWQLGEVRQVKGRGFHDVVHANCEDLDCDLRLQLHRMWPRVLTGELVSWEAFDKLMGRVLDWQIRPLAEANQEGDSFAIVVVTDVTTERAMQARLEGIYQLGQELALLHNPEKVIWQVLSLAQSLVAFDHVVYGEVDYEKNVLKYRYAVHHGERLLQDKIYSLDEERGGGVQAVRKQAIIRVPDINQSQQYEAYNESLANGSALCLPVRYQEQFFGVLNLARQRPEPFVVEDERLLEALAAQMAIALENARLYEKQKEQVKQLAESQKQLIWSEKLAALGRLTASVAHEINNPLQAIDGCLTLMQESVGVEGGNARIKRYLGIVESEIERIATIVQRMRGVYRADESEEMKPVDVQATLRDVLALTEKQLTHHDVRLTTVWSDEEIFVLANEGNLKQVFLNLLINAGDAMSGVGGNLNLTVRVRQGILGTYSDEQSFVEIEFADDGPGIPVKVQKKLFEPFFTTKDKGSGLGLYVSYGIIEAHHGEFTFESGEGEGTTFYIRLPLLVPN
ncbi:MAG TPA: PAS domain-containing protein [Anaerolineae bacterium]|nr:PAS domain-containing protein [Anaerolineae bacterium]